MDRRKMLALLGTSPALLTGSPAYARPAGLAGPAAPPALGSGQIAVLNPAIAGKFAERFPLVPRLASLEGKTLYMIDIQWGGADSAHSFFEAVQDWFAKNMSSVKTVVTRTKTNMFADDPSIRKEMIEKKADAAIVGIAG
jgi:hypothetical protein